MGTENKWGRSPFISTPVNRDWSVDRWPDPVGGVVQFNGGITWDQAIDQNPAEVQNIVASYWQPAA